MTARPTITPMISVYDGRSCVGFILSRGRAGYEVFNRDERSLSAFFGQILRPRAAATAQ